MGGAVLPTPRPAARPRTRSPQRSDARGGQHCTCDRHRARGLRVDAPARGGVTSASELASLPTPIEDAPRLSEALGVRVCVKRDDLTGLALGGNKARKLRNLCAEAIEQH